MVKVRVLYQTAFAALGIEGDDEADVPADQAEALIAQGYAEPIKAKAAPKEEPEEEPAKRGPGRPKKTG